jgi:DNA-binding response OmpR family regulator
VQQILLGISPAFREVQNDLSQLAAEFDLLALFLKAPGKVIAREEIVTKVLGRELAPFDRSIDVHVSNLRKKLGSARDGRERIKAIRSVGYVYAMPDKLRDR